MLKEHSSTAIGPDDGGYVPLKRRQDDPLPHFATNECVLRQNPEQQCQDRH